MAQGKVMDTTIRHYEDTEYGYNEEPSALREEATVFQVEIMTL